MDNSHRPSLQEIRERHHFDIASLARQCRVDEQIVIMMLCGQPVERGQAEQILQAISEIIGQSFTLATVNVPLLPPAKREIGMIEQPAEPIQITAPITKLYREAFMAFFQRHGCTIEQMKREIGGAQLYRITLPRGTQRQRMIQAIAARYRLTLPDGTELEEVQAGGQDYSFLYADVNI